MRSNAMRAAVLLVAPLAAAAACATADESDPKSPSVDGQKVPPAEAPDADAAVIDAGDSDVDAGPCSDSGLCTFPAPIDTRVNVTSISGSGPNDVWAVGSSRTILHYDGSAWEKTEIVAETSGPVTMRAVWLGGADDVWIADGLFVRHSTGWKGNATEWTSWMGAAGDSSGLPMAITGSGGRVFVGRQVERMPNAAAIVTCMGFDPLGLVDEEDLDTEIFDVTDIGKNATATGAWSIAMTGPDEAWVTKLASPRVARVHRVNVDGGDDVGASWVVEEHDSHSTRDILGVWGDERAVWLVGEGGTVRRITREQVPTRVFEIVASPAISTLRGIHGFGADDIWAVGDDATVLHWNGDVWSRLTTTFDTAKEKPRFISVWGSGPNDVWIGGDGVMLHFEGTAP